MEEARVAREEGRTEESAALLRAAANEAPHLASRDGERIAGALGQLAATLCELGRLDEAEECYERAWEITEAAVGPDHLHTALTLLNRAEIRMSRGRAEEADPIYRRLLAILDRQGDSAVALLATALTRLAAAGTTLGRADEAVVASRRAVGILENGPQPNPLLLMALEALDNALQRTGATDEARFIAARAAALEADIRRLREN